MTLRLNGSTSGYTEIDAPAVAGSNTLVLPTGAGSANQFLKNGSTAGSLGWSNLVEDSSNRLLVGTSTSTGAYYDAASDWQGRFQVARSDQNAVASFSIWNSEASTYTNYGGVQLHLSACRSGTVGSHTSGALSSGNTIGSITFDASDGTNFRNSARIEAVVDGGVSTGDVPGRLVFSTTADGAASPSEAMRIDSSGSVLIRRTGFRSGTTNACSLNVRGLGGDWTADFENPATTAANCYGIVLSYSLAAPNNTGNQFFRCSDSSALRAEIRSNGGLANFSANNANLSDRNAKKDITPAAGTWDCLKEWEIVNYRYKDQPDDADLNLGVIAQQVAESCPEVITIFQEAKEATETEPAQEERLGVKEQQMYWMAIKALQEAQARIEQLESKVAALESA